MYVTERHDLTFAVKMALSPNATKQPDLKKIFYLIIYRWASAIQS